MDNNYNTLNQIHQYTKIINYEKFYLIKDNMILKIFIEYTEKGIYLRYRNYIALLNLNNFSLLIGNIFNSLEIAYNFIINLFEKNKVFIKNIETEKKVILILSIKEQKEVEVNLLFDKKKSIINGKIILNEINSLKKEIKALKEENNKLKSEINKLKKYHDDKNPTNIQLLSDITKDSYADDNSDNSFTLFNSINNLLYIIYSNIERSIVCYNLNSQKKICEIKNAHYTFITNFRYYFDKTNKRDIILSLSCKDNNIKLWNFKNWNCILNLIDINNKGDIYSVCFLNENNNNYFATSNCNWNESSEPLKIYDFEGNKIKEINDSSDKTFFLEAFFDNNLSNYYRITGNFSYIKAYDINKNELYHIYNDKDNKCHLSIIVQKSGKIVKMIDSCTDGNIRIWDFHSALLLAKIKISN